MKRLLGIAVLSVLACLAAAPIARASQILSLDDTRTGDEGEAGDDRYLTSTSMANATNVLLNAGFTIGTTDRFTAANTAGACVLFTGAVDTDFTAGELTDIAAFVSAGGGLVVMRDWGTFYPAADPLASVFGATYSIGPYGNAAVANVVNQSAAHAIWSGPGGTANTYDQVYSSSVTGATGIGVHASDPGEVALAYTNHGLGRVVFLTDMDGFDDFDDPVSPTPGSNNAIVWENVFHFACGAVVPEPTTYAALASLASVGFGIGWLRRRRRNK